MGDAQEELTNCTFTDNSAHFGGGMFNTVSHPTLDGCTFTSNTADYGGGMFNDNSNPSLTDTVVCGNTPDQIYGGWTDNGGNIVADECPIDCPDLDGDGEVKVADLLLLIGAWGPALVAWQTLMVMAK